MDDDRKKPGSGGRGRGPGKPGDARPGDRKPYPKRDRDSDAKPFRGKDGERRSFSGQDGEKRPYSKPAHGDARNGERKPYPKRDGDNRPTGRQDGAKRAFAGRDGAAPGKPRPGKREREEFKDAAAQPDERIAKRLARAGVASRRDAEDMIAAGRVTVNGTVLASPAVNVGPHDRIELDCKLIPAVERTRLFLFNKPAGVVTTNRDPQERKTVFDVLPKGLPRLVTIGRLDINTEGLLLLTNDGGLARLLELPATGWLRRYRVRVHGKVDAEALVGLKDGIAVDGVFYGAIEASLDREQGSNAWLTIGLREGKNREVKNILGALGLDVTRLIRISYGPFQLGELAEGEVHELRGRLLRDQLGERLIAEAGANFEAPVLNEFSSKPVSPRPQRPAHEAGGPPNRKREREAKREDALGRLDTKKPPRPGGQGKPSARGERPVEEARSRVKNVWMAPGAKPLGEKKKAALAERTEGRRYAGKPRPGGPGGKPRASGDGPRQGGPGGTRSGPRKPRGKG